MNKVMICRIALVFAVVCSNVHTRASGLDSFLKFAQQGGSMTSVNAGGVIEDQRSGFLTGGSIISRGPRPMELQPLGVQLPSGSFDGCT